jgi:hypothetical protein
MSMSAFVSSGHVVDLALILLMVEAMWATFRGHRGRLVLSLLPGACLLLALRASLTGEHWVWVALWLSASLPAHLIDLWRR